MGHSPPWIPWVPLAANNRTGLGEPDRLTQLCGVIKRRRGLMMISYTKPKHLCFYLKSSHQACEHSPGTHCALKYFRTTWTKFTPPRPLQTKGQCWTRRVQAFTCRPDLSRNRVCTLTCVVVDSIIINISVIKGRRMVQHQESPHTRLVN